MQRLSVAERARLTPRSAPLRMMRETGQFEGEKGVEQCPGGECAGTGVGGLCSDDVIAEVVGEQGPQTWPRDGEVETVDAVNAGV